MEFRRSVALWKMLGILSYCYIGDLILMGIIAFIFHMFSLPISKFFFILSIVLFPIPVYAYFRSILLIPVQHEALTRKQLMDRAVFYVTSFFWAYFTGLGFMTSRYSFISAISLVLFLIKTKTFSIVVVFDNSPRLPLLVNTFHISELLFHILYSGCLLIFSPFAFVVSIGIAYSCEIFCNCTEIIAGELVSFTSRDGHRIADSMLSDDIFTYLSVSYLYEISRQKLNLYRKFIFRDATSAIFSHIVESLSTVFESYANCHEDLSEKSFPVPISMLNDPVYRKNNAFKLLRANKNVIAAVREHYMTRWSRRACMMAEVKALRQSVTVIKGIKALVNLITESQSEDKFGVVQVSAEKILNSIITVYRYVNKTVNRGWISNGFGEHWYAKNESLLCIEVLETCQWAMDEIIGKYGEDLDMSLLSKKNRKVALTFLEY